MREIQVFGGLSGRGQRPAGDPQGRRSRVLLAWLALHPGSHAPRELAGRFWPDIAEDAARTNLRSALTELRQGLGIASRLLAADRERVALNGRLGRRAGVRGARHRRAPRRGGGAVPQRAAGGCGRLETPPPRPLRASR